MPTDSNPHELLRASVSPQHPPLGAVLAATYGLPVVTVMVRSAWVAAFAAQVVTISVTSGEIGWATWRRFGLGWRFWMGLGESSATLAFASLVACLLLAVFRRSYPEVKLKDTSWCAWLNIATIALLYFVPAIAAV